MNCIYWYLIMNPIKEFYIKTVSFLSSVLVFYFGLRYLSSSVSLVLNNFCGFLISMILQFITILFLMLPAYFVLCDAKKIMKKNHMIFSKILIILMLSSIFIGLAGALFSSANEMKVIYVNRYNDGKYNNIPEALLQPCEIPEVPEHMTWGDSIILNERLLTALEKCNADKRAMREINN